MTRPTILTIFDVDGTLLLNGDAARVAFLRAFHETTGVDAHPMGVKFAGMTDRGIVRVMLDHFGVEGDYEQRFQAFAGRFTELMREGYAGFEGPTLLPGVRELIEQLSRRDEAALALGTGNIRETAYIKLSRFGLDHHFKAGGFGGEHEDRAKMVEAAMDEAARVYGWEGEAWVIGDTPRDIAAARGAGAKVLAVATGMIGLDELKSHEPDALFEDLLDTQEVLRTLGF